MLLPAGAEEAARPLESLSWAPGLHVSVCPAYFSPPRTVAFSPPTLSAASPTAVSAEPRFRGPETQPLIPGQVPEAEHAFWKIPGMEVGVARREGHAEVKPACQAGVPPVDPHTVAWHRLWTRRGRPESWNLKELTPPRS